MRRMVLAALTAIAFLSFGSLAVSQAPTPANPQVPPPTSRINLSMEQEHTIKELAKDLKIAPETNAAAGAQGNAVPAGITLRPIPAEIGDRVPQIRSHQFYLAGEKVVLVDPTDNTIVVVID